MIFERMFEALGIQAIESNLITGVSYGFISLFLIMLTIWLLWLTYEGGFFDLIKIVWIGLTKHWGRGE